MGCHFLLQCMKVKSESEVAQSCLTLHDPMDCSPPSSSIHGVSRQEYWSGVPLPSPEPRCTQLQLPIPQKCELNKYLFFKPLTSGVVCSICLHTPHRAEPTYPCLSYLHWLFFLHYSPGKNTQVGCHSLLQEIFPTQVSNLGLLHCRWIPYWLSHQGPPNNSIYLHWLIFFALFYCKFFLSFYLVFTPLK